MVFSAKDSTPCLCLYTTKSGLGSIKMTPEELLALATINPELEEV
jgi:hypothetical protein